MGGTFTRCQLIVPLQRATVISRVLHTLYEGDAISWQRVASIALKLTDRIEEEWFSTVDAVYVSRDGWRLAGSLCNTGHLNGTQAIVNVTQAVSMKQAIINGMLTIRQRWSAIGIPPNIRMYTKQGMRCN